MLSLADLIVLSGHAVAAMGVAALDVSDAGEAVSIEAMQKLAVAAQTSAEVIGTIAILSARISVAMAEMQASPTDPV